MEKTGAKREGFSSGIAVFFATLGSAVGLGNIWKFPYLTGKSGGGAFLLVYLICILLVGIPVMVSEFYIGRRTRKNAVGAFEVLKPGSGWKSIGYMGIFAAYFIMFFYSCVAGWVYSYVFKAVRGDFNGVDAALAESRFGQTITGTFSPVLWQFIVLAVVSAILIAGVKKGIEKVTKTLMPVLFILIVICGVRALTLPGAFEGVKFLFQVDFSQIKGDVLLTALGLAFFKLSLGMGTMMTYASYFTQDNKLISTSLKVALSDTLVSILAGLAIFPAVFAFGMKPESGPGLLFMTIPMVFSKMYMGNILLIAFFILSAIAATTAMISIVEVPVAFFTEEKGLSRTKSVLLNTGIIFILGIPAALSADGAAPMGGMKVFGKSFFDLFDFLSSNVLLPLGGLLIAIFIGYFIKKKDFASELTNNETLNVHGVVDVLHFIIRYVTPAMLLIVFLNSIGVLKGLLALLNISK